MEADYESRTGSKSPQSEQQHAGRGKERAVKEREEKVKAEETA